MGSILKYNRNYCFIKTSGILLLCLLCCSKSFSQPKGDADTSFFNTVQHWFEAWELLSKEIYGLKKTDPVDFLFFDETSVYSTSDISASGGQSIDGPYLMAKQLAWKKKSYSDSIVLPDGKIVEAGLMSFASSNKNRRPYFVMPLMSIWQQAGVTSKELGLENLVTGVFLHEFSHSQQMKNFGKRIASFEKDHPYPVEFSDDIIQQVFNSETGYPLQFHTEVQVMYNAVAQQDQSNLKLGAGNGLEMMNSRHQFFFLDSLSHYKEIDRFFLTMEGLGQYSMYIWLIHPKGANLPKEVVIPGVRRGKKQWSQDEGFALFLILDRLASAKSWAPKMFGKNFSTVTTLIEERIK